jgi:hypothetical protein
MTPTFCRASIRFRWAILSLMSILVVTIASNLALSDDGEGEDPQAEEFAEVDERKAGIVEIVRSERTFNELVSAVNWEDAAVTARNRLMLILDQRVESTCCTGELTDAQNGKLILAGRGDIERLIDRVEAWKQRRDSVQRGGETAQILNELTFEALSLQALFESGPFEEKSLFAKTMRNSLSAEQIADFETIRQIERDGGQVTAHGEGSDAVWGISFTRVVFPRNSLVSLVNLKGLRFLTLESVPATDADLMHLKRLTTLEHLDLSETLVTDHGLAHLLTLTRLKSLRLNHTQVTGAGFEHLEGLTDLEELSVAESRVDDEGLAHLARLTGLRSLDLSGTRVTNSGMPYLREVTGLERLRLDRTEVSDSGLNPLKRLKDLEFLSCRQTTVSHVAAGTLRRWRPRLRVEN